MRFSLAASVAVFRLVFRHAATIEINRWQVFDIVANGLVICLHVWLLVPEIFASKGIVKLVWRIVIAHTIMLEIVSHSFKGFWLLRTVIDSAIMLVKKGSGHHCFSTFYRSFGNLPMRCFSYVSILLIRVLRCSNIVRVCSIISKVNWSVRVMLVGFSGPNVTL